MAMARNCPALIPAPQAPQKPQAPAGDSFAPAVHLPGERSPGPTCPRLFIGGEQRRSHHHMVLWPVHIAEGQVHHPAEDSGGVGGSLRQAQAEDGVHALGMAVIANIMAVDAPGLAGFLFMADGALHVLVPDQIFQRCLADQAFFWMQIDHSSLIRSAGSHAAAQSPTPPTICCGEMFFLINRLPPMRSSTHQLCTLSCYFLSYNSQDNPLNVKSA